MVMRFAQQLLGKASAFWTGGVTLRAVGGFETWDCMGTGRVPGSHSVVGVLGLPGRLDEAEPRCEGPFGAQPHPRFLDTLHVVCN